MQTEIGNMIYEGKAKKIYEIKGKADWLLHDFKNSLTAFNGQKKGDFSDKGKLNRDMTAMVFRFLTEKGVVHHFVDVSGETGIVARRLQMIPLEVVVRNRFAGSLAKKFGIEEGKTLKTPLVELYWKDDKLGDPFISDDQALMMEAATPGEISELKAKALQINTNLIEFFGRAGLSLVDFKLEFGRDPQDKIMLADEITPDTCRLWDEETGERMDKDRFRRDLGNVQETYQNVYQRLTKAWGGAR
ncbi:MAG: phosphoribosylaminoimidazolesuccinocarboxamide synthase [Bdellovibrionales bacterium]|nr:phosphoribosylaminoimidazolesuccinocarboxamide synthase [Bdellovibrionales bacterium]